MLGIALTVAALVGLAVPSAASAQRLAHRVVERSSDPDQNATIYLLGSGGQLNWYDINGNLLGQRQLSDTNGIAMCGDGHDQLFVVDSPVSSSGDQYIEKFRTDKKKPSLVLDAGYFGGVVQCAVNPATLDVGVVGNFYSSYQYGFVEIFANGQTKPYYERGTIRPYLLFTLGWGPGGDLWAAGMYYLSPAVSHLNNDFFPQYLPRNYSQSNQNLTGLQVTRNYDLLVENSTFNRIDIYPRLSLTWPNPSAQILTVDLPGIGDASGFQLTPSGQRLFTLGGGQVYGFPYPAGTTPFATIDFNAIGIAIMPKRPK